MEEHLVGVLDGKQVELTREFVENADGATLARVVCTTKNGIKIRPFRKDSEVELLGFGRQKIAK